ncbi:MAG TPA: hypothetical protein VFM46_09815, partial [Pseudomonadales bacterium]|nr:hypothetical protein [Pseudomonadales bacterium]
MAFRFDDDDKTVEYSPLQPEAFDLTSSQQVIWLDQSLNPEIPLYNIGLVTKLTGDLDKRRLEAAIAIVA